MAPRTLAQRRKRNLRRALNRRPSVWSLYDGKRAAMQRCIRQNWLEGVQYAYGLGIRYDGMFSEAIDAGALRVARWLMETGEHEKGSGDVLKNMAAYHGERLYVFLDWFMESKGNAECAVEYAALLAEHGQGAPVEDFLRRYADRLDEKALRRVLIGAAGGGDLALVKILDERYHVPMDSHREVPWKPNVMMAAMTSGNLRLVKYLHGRGVRLTDPGNSPYKPLHHVPRLGHLHILQYLEEQGLDFKGMTTGGGYTLFMRAAAGGQKDVAEWLLLRGADPHAVDTYRQNAAHVAAAWGQANFLYYLAGLGVDMSLKDVTDSTPMEFAKRDKTDTRTVHALRRILGARE